MDLLEIWHFLVYKQLNFNIKVQSGSMISVKLNFKNGGMHTCMTTNIQNG